ncbi:hypothetical protein [Ochrobactrum chromiisoli]|uniref:Uncharacterized protein n=1 Tax=Ochrobactrum chromiisoli TaxID=2993941 RepID=A0ABT3QN69_9HYPH|nr:hypothetical protein [Ochrobactrum chromiisoli]MCX2697053.1 hypothetical protein [Ochrobactrum chromiisoli]
MLSDNIREMRREFQNALLEHNGGDIVISGENLQSFAIALVMFEDEALNMEEKLGVRPVLTNACGSVVVPLRPSNRPRPQLTVIHGDGGDVA